MKRIFLLAFSLFIMLQLHAQTSTVPSGSGTSADPYQITTLNNLYWLSQNSSAWSSYFIQTADIDASDTKNWNSGTGFSTIGDNDTEFTGYYDGANYSITGLYLNYLTRISGNLGLFGRATGATINNVRVLNINFTGTAYIGGLVGTLSSSTVTNCFSSGSVTSSTTGPTGGLIGATLNSTVTNSHSACKVSGAIYAGGLIGQNLSATVSGCYSTGNVSGTAHVGGLMGKNESAVSNSYSTGNVVTVSYGGGLIGFNVSTVSNCYSTGSVTGTDNNSNIGGLIGYASYNSDESSSSAVSNCYSTGSVSGKTVVGGLVGHNVSPSTLTSCFWDTQSSGTTTGIGSDNNSQTATGLTTNNMKVSSNFTAWDLTTVWGFPDGKVTYPALRGISNNPPFAFDNAVNVPYSITLSTALLVNDNNYGTYHQDDSYLVYKIISFTGTHGTISGDTYTSTGIGSDNLVYRVGELVAAGDTLWGNQATAVLTRTATTVTWTGTSWNPCFPCSLDNVNINGNYSGDGFSCNNLTINGLNQVTFTSDASVNGNLNILQQSTIINQGALTVTGTTSVKRYLTGSGVSSPTGRGWYISSPISGATRSTFNFNSGNKLWSWEEVGNAYTEITDDATVLNVLQGYVARIRTNNTVTFTGGKLNDGDYSTSLSRTGASQAERGFQLVGNPYLSYLDWEQVTKTNLSTTIWYRTASTDGTTMVFDTYNATSQAGTKNNGSSAVNQYIPPLQGFWVRVAADGTTGTLAVNNTMRSHQSTTSNPLRVAANLTTSIKNNLLRLDLSNGTNSDEAIVLFNNNAGAGLTDWDSEKRMETDATIPQIYTKEGAENLVINSLPELTDGLTIPLYITVQQAGTHTLTVNTAEFSSAATILLQDLQTNALQNITDGAYTFTSDKVTDNKRFALLVRNETTGIASGSQSNVSIYANGNTAYINIPCKGTIEVIDLSGKVITGLKASQGINTIQLQNAGVYMVKVSTETEVKIEKVIIK